MKPTVLSREQMRKALRDRNLMRVSEGTGICYRTVVTFRGGSEIKADTMEKLSEYLMRDATS